MGRILILLIVLVTTICLHSQSYFNILPDVGGVDSQAMAFIVVPDSNSIQIIGHRYDTVLPGSNAKPWLGKFNYDGELMYALPVVDPQYDEPFNVFNNPLAPKIDDFYYYYAKRDTGGTFFNPYLIELNLNSGEIIRSTIIRNDNYPNLSYSGTFIRYDSSNNSILLLNSLHKSDSIKTFISILDTVFNIEKVIEVQESHRANYAHYGKINKDRTFTIIGYALIENKGEPDYYTFYINIVDSTGHILYHNLAPTTLPLTLGIAHTRTIIQDKFENWVIAGLYWEDREDSCFNCYQLIPYVFSASSDFDSLLWQTRFFDVPNQNYPQYFLHSMTKVHDGYIVAGDYHSGNSFPESGVLFKTSNAGDSLWMKHFVPLNWEDDRVVWANLNDVKTTPFESIVAVGAVNDNVLRKISPWVLHLDKDGCLIPGCNTVSTHQEKIDPAHKNQFLLYPNPATTEIYLLSTITTNNPINISVLSNNGITIKRKDFNLVEGYQYILPISDLISGIYHLILTDPNTAKSETHTFIKE